MDKNPKTEVASGELPMQNNLTDKSKTVFSSIAKFIRMYSEDLSRVFVLIALFIALIILSPNFANVNNLLNVLRVASLNLILATGMALTMLVSGIDLSIGSVIALSTMMFAQFFQQGRSITEMVLGIIGILVISAVVGIINGLSVAYVGLPAFIATFAMSQIARGYSYYLSKGIVFARFTETFQFIGGGYLFGIPMPVIFAALLLLVIGFMLNKTTFGRRIYAVGSNKEAAKYSGINVKQTMVITYMLSALVAGFGGIIYLSRLNAAEANIGLDFPLQAISAAAIGGISFKGGKGNVFGIIAGALMLTLVTNGMNLLGIDSDWQMGITGLIILIGVLLDRSYAKKKN
jgi:ribose transport system permease protein